MAISPSSVAFTLLVDHEASSTGLRNEHGLSIWIEVGPTRILFDTGASDAFRWNAKSLGIDLSQTDAVVLSHGHYDHGGGLPFLQGLLRPETPIYAHPGIFQTRFSRHRDGSLHPVGLSPLSQEFLHAHQAAFRPITAPTFLPPLPTVIAETSPSHPATPSLPRMGLTGPIPRLTPIEDPGGDFYLDRGWTVPDPIEDDLALWIEAKEGLWIFLGCAHAGVINTIRYIQKLSGRKDVYAVIGGTHLRNASPERLAATEAFLRDLSPTLFFPCHCSGTHLPRWSSSP